MSTTRTKAAHAGRPSQAQTTPTSSHTRAIRAKLLAWYGGARRDLPWRRTKDPYAIWLSEVMLQQTRVETVVPYYERFLARFPTVERLADASADDVLAAWSGLGYYRRARLLHAGARHVAAELAGALPRTRDALLEVPGVGRYTAGAIASIAFGESAPLVDGNVARVLARLFAIEDDPKSAAGAKRLWALAEQLVAGEAPGDWNQALMELGATICVPREPRCASCPVAGACAARAAGRERELPRVAKKKAPKTMELVALVARDAKERVLFGRRGEGGTFARMWEPPTAPRGEGDPARAHFVKARGVREVGRVEHVLSHRRLDVVVLAAASATTPPPGAGGYERFEWVRLERASELALASFARKVLAAAGCGSMARTSR